MANDLASRAALTLRGTAPALASALPPVSLGRAGRAASRRAGGPRGAGRAAAGRLRTARGELAVDEREGLLAVLLAVALVDVGVVSCAAVRVCGIAVGLDLGRAGADEASRAGVKLVRMAVLENRHVQKMIRRRLTPWVVQVPTLYGSP